MKYGIYAFRDIALAAFMQPFYQANDTVAMRTARQAAADQQSTIHRNIEDIELFKLGEFDDITGEIKSDCKMMVTAGGLKEGAKNDGN